MSKKQLLTTFLMMFDLTGCTLVPGMHMSQFARQSSIEMPVEEHNATLLKKLNIQTITAQTIIDLEKNFNNRSLGPDNVANHYFDYRIGSKAVKGGPDDESHTQYLIGPKDILSITVWEHPELTSPAGEYRTAESTGTVVREDGTIFYPYAGIIKVAGRTTEDVREELAGKLAKYIEQVQLDVRVTTYRSQRVYVVGEVKQPGTHLVKDIPLTVLEAINEAGGLNSGADLRNLTLTRDGKTYSINLLALYEGGDISQNIILKHGDVLNVPDNSLNKIFVLGEIGGSGGGGARSIVMNKGRMTLTEAISDSGGVSQATADAARIFVFRSGIKKPEIFHLNAKSPDALLLADRFPLQPRDVIYVDRAEGVRWNQIIAEIQPTILMLSVLNNATKVTTTFGQ